LRVHRVTAQTRDKRVQIEHRGLRQLPNEHNQRHYEVDVHAQVDNYEQAEKEEEVLVATLIHSGVVRAELLVQ